MRFSRQTILATLVLIFHAVLLNAADWPHWRGPQRDGISTETDLLEQWPAQGPKLLWSAEDLGKGYASVAVVDGIVHTTGMHDDQGVLFAFDANGTLKYRRNYGPEWTGPYPGSRTTPTVDGPRLYLISGHGRIVCLQAADGKEIWHVDTLDEFAGENIEFGITESLLIYKDTVICTPGGKDAGVVALDKLTGKTVWTSKGLSELSGYCSPRLIHRPDKDIIVTILASSFVGIDAQNGAVLWSDLFRPDVKGPPGRIHPNSPLFRDSQLYINSSYGKGGVMYTLADDALSITRKWTDPILDVHHGGCLLIDGHIYAADNPRGAWVCLNWDTGKVLYEDKALKSKGAVIAADGLIYFYTERGTVALVKPSTEKFELISSFDIPLGAAEHWAHPAIADGTLYIRHGDALMAYDIKQR